MSNPADLLQAASYALRTEGKENRAEKLAIEILSKYPNSSEAAAAKKLLAEIEGPAVDTPIKREMEQTIAKVEVTNQSRGVVITDIDIPFLPLVGIMVKWIIASSPAMIIATVILFFIFTIFAGMVGLPIASRY